jgi:hypothetical protein
MLLEFLSLVANSVTIIVVENGVSSAESYMYALVS